MSLFKKIMHSLGFRCAVSVSLGLATVAIITMGLIVVSGADLPAEQATTVPSLRFAEDEQMLKDLSTKIMRDSDSRNLADIEPAAGGDTVADENLLAPPQKVMGTEIFGPQKPDSLTNLGH